MSKGLNQKLQGIEMCRRSIIESNEIQWLKELRLFGLKLIEKRVKIDDALKRFPDNSLLQAKLKQIIRIENEYWDMFDRVGQKLGRKN